MRQINIPEKVLPGFQAIAKLSNEQIKELSTYLAGMPVGTKFDDIDSFISNQLNVTSSKVIVQTLISFGEILEPSKVNFEELAEGLAKSFKDLSKEEVAKDLIEQLQINLISIFNHSENLKLTLKARKLFFENENLFSGSKIICDVRPVFNNDDLENKRRNALLIHRLHIMFKAAGESNEIFLTLDREDLQKLKDDIERAMRKEDILKNDYKNDLNFI